MYSFMVLTITVDLLLCSAYYKVCIFVDVHVSLIHVSFNTIYYRFDIMKTDTSAPKYFRKRQRNFI